MARLDTLEYVVLRMVRRFLFTDRTLRRVGRYIPYYRTNCNEVDGDAVAALYGRWLTEAGYAPRDGVILEIGSGITNAVGYAMARRAWSAAGRIVLFEPFAALDEAADGRQRQGLPAELLARVSRVSSLAGIASGSVDLVVSHSVLEHVRDMSAMLAAFDRMLSPTGAMLHVVDYRDHFFKYPFHFLLFSRAAWQRWLDPGDLPRWRLREHLQLFAEHGFDARVLERQTDEEAFAKVASRIHPDFGSADPEVRTTQAVLFVTRAR